MSVRNDRPTGFWNQQRSWDIRSVDDAMRVRNSISAHVAAVSPASDDSPFFASAAARAETAAGELLLNGLDHGAGPVTARLSRGAGAWLLEVTDSAAGAAPTIGAPDLAAPGGLGLRLTVSLSDGVGWYVAGRSKTVWAEIGDQAPARLMESLSHQNG